MKNYKEIICKVRQFGIGGFGLPITAVIRSDISAGEDDETAAPRVPYFPGVCGSQR
ncbi:UNVERIFIED_CONTAM: hypothetical protein Sradi_5383600 [Sesamum radiatum]|uniref:Uncharacterized protein n=1 Tax=Sesamum radiatum TaxID=300843 RepID=A0AAW2LTX0_SESRA